MFYYQQYQTLPRGGQPFTPKGQNLDEKYIFKNLKFLVPQKWTAGPVLAAPALISITEPINIKLLTF